MRISPTKSVPVQRAIIATPPGRPPQGAPCTRAAFALRATIPPGAAQGPALPSTDTVDLLIAQAHGKQVQCITVFALDALPEVVRTDNHLRIAGIEIALG